MPIRPFLVVSFQCCPINWHLIYIQAALHFRRSVSTTGRKIMQFALMGRDGFQLLNFSLSSCLYKIESGYDDKEYIPFIYISYNFSTFVELHREEG